MGFPGGTSGKKKNLSAKARDMRHKFDPWVGKIPWRKEWQPTPVFLPGEFHEQRRLVGYSPWGHEESDTTEYTYMHGTLSPIEITDTLHLILKLLQIVGFMEVIRPTIRSC